MFTTDKQHRAGINRRVPRLPLPLDKVSYTFTLKELRQRNRLAAAAEPGCGQQFVLSAMLADREASLATSVGERPDRSRTLLRPLRVRRATRLPSSGSELRNIVRLPSTPSEKMYRALQHQLDAEYLDARRLYLEEIAERGKSPDVWNMLAIVEWHLGNVDKAGELIADAVQLAPNVSAIRSNEELIHRARRCASSNRRYSIRFGCASDRLWRKTADPRMRNRGRSVGRNGAPGNRTLQEVEQCCRYRPLTQNPSVPSILTSRHPITQLDESRGNYPQGGRCSFAARTFAWVPGSSKRPFDASSCLQRRRPDWDLDAAGTGLHTW